MPAGRDRPVMGGSFGGVVIHDSVADCLERIEWLKANAPDAADAIADAERKLAIAQEQENQ